MVIRSIDGIRIASTTSIQTLMQSDFDLVINDVTFRVATPPFQSSSTSSLVVDDEMKRMGDVRALVGQLYEVRNGVSTHHLVWYLICLLIVGYQKSSANQFLIK